VVVEITTGDNPKRTDGRQGSRLRAAQRVLTVAVSHQLAFQAARQVQVAREHVARIGVARPLVTFTLRPASIVASIAAAFV
jgi:hypothetical protein